MKKAIIGIAAMLTMAGCVHRIGDFTVASSKNMDITDHLHRVDTGNRVTGDDTVHIIIFIPTGIPNMKEAMDNAIEKAPGAVGLSDVTVKLGAFYIPLIYGQQWYEVEGTPVYQLKK